ncbi:MAG: TRAP transporter small permease subunit [Planctomycetaceae bacterium]|nr:TRAP transporter small permease subunit [Planctomycetaceae bacterium]
MHKDWEKHLLAGLLAAIAVNMLAAAVTRHCFPAWQALPLKLAAGCLTWLASIGMARAAALGTHTRVSFIEDMAMPQTVDRLRTIADIAFLAFSLCSFAYGCVVFAASIARPGGPGHPLIYAAIPIGSALTAVRLVQRLRARLGKVETAGP